MEINNILSSMYPNASSVELAGYNKGLILELEDLGVVYTSIIGKSITINIEGHNPTAVGTLLIGGSEIDEFIHSLKSQYQAQQAIEKLDTVEGMKDLLGGSERVQVDDKRMINCRADLNQLVPFKYAWAWVSYLDATTNHWMHLEINDSPLNLYSLSNIECGHLLYALYSLESVSAYRTLDPLLGCYRLLTNPEARQYILRQRFELTVWGNAVHHIFDCNEGMTSNELYTKYLSTPIVEERSKAKLSISNYIASSDSSTKVLDSLNRIALQYIGLGLVFNGHAIYLLYKYAKCGVGTSLSELSKFLIRDLALQTSFGVKCLATILEEDSNQTSMESVWENINNCITLEMGIESTLFLGADNKSQTIPYLVSRVLTSLGVKAIDYDESQVDMDFVSLFNSFTNNLDSNGSTVLTSSPSDSGAGSSLEWD